MSLLHQELTDSIIRAFYEVYNALGTGFLEKVYENAFKLELERNGLNVASQVPIAVYYLGQPVGEYFCDLCVENKVIIEIKTVDRLAKAHEAQLLNYLKATSMEIGLLFNFGPRPELARKILTNDRKQLNDNFSDN